MTDTTPHLIVVDVETSGLDPNMHDVLEVAAIDLTTGAEHYFVPTPTSLGWRTLASGPAMRVNRYFERAVYDNTLDERDTIKAWEELATMLDGNILAGVNPWFDAAFVDAALAHHRIECRRSHRLRDLATYAAGVLGTDPSEPASAADIFAILDVTNEEAHSALGDTRATARAFQLLRGGE
ncbi:exonuclease domain-containing protein [Dietzia alimentaria]|uniref:3'-5' exonuclease n=1 Tax=Dietzia alimentaria TaxID=665550 RepID=UPI00029A8EF3|nr:exonuclease domain-containing protein [Dietzia alimentaria]